MADAQLSLEEIRSKDFIKSFPNDNKEATYNQLMMLISFEYIEEKVFQELQKNGPDLVNLETAATIRHELTHYWDHIGTLWGQQNIRLMFDALNAYALGNIDEYWRIKLLHQKCRTDEFGVYYTEVYQDDYGSFERPWKTEVSCGVRFDNDGRLRHDLPLLFIKFKNAEGEDLARTPISVAALLEANATYQEFKLKADFINGLENSAEKAHEMEAMLKDLEDQFFSTDYALYNVVAHLVAKHTLSDDILGHYELASALGTIALNLPEEVIKGIRMKAEPMATLNERFNALALNGDRGFAYFRLVENLAVQFPGEFYSLHNALEASGLPGEEDLMLKTMEAMFFNIYEVTPGPFNAIAQLLLNFGIEVFRQRGFDGRKESFADWSQANEVWPYIYFKDTKAYPHKLDQETAVNDPLDKNGDVDFTTHYKVFAYYNDKMSEFYETCGV